MDMEKSDDSFFDLEGIDWVLEPLPSINSAGNSPVMEVEEESECNADDVLFSSPNQNNRKRDRCESSNIPTAEGTNTKKLCFSRGEPSEARPSQEHKPKSINAKQTAKEHLRDKTVYEVTVILNNRRYRKGKKEGSSVKDDAEQIIKKLANIRNASRLMSQQGTSEKDIKMVMETKLEEVEKEIEKLAGRGSEDSEKTSKLAEHFLNAADHVDEDTTKFLNKECSSAFPEHFGSKSANQGQVISRKTPDSEKKYTVKDVPELEEKLFHNNKKTAGFSDFHDLKEEVIAAGCKIPKSLQDFATKFREVCGEKIARDAYFQILVFLSAAAREMMEKHEGIHQLSWERLSIWGATYNQAREMGFEQELQFMKVHLKKLLHAYLGFQFGKAGDPIQCFQLQNEGDLKELVRRLDSGLQMVKQCLSAAEFFEEKPLIHGLFP